MTIRHPQDIVEKTILLIPHRVLSVPHSVHCPSDPHCVLEELNDELLEDRIMECQFHCNPQHLLAEEHHPSRSVRLFQMAPTRQRCAPVEHPDIVQTEESALKQIVSCA